MFTTLYIFEMLLCSALFYALYRLLLEGRVAHSVARFYLVATTLLAVSIPMMELPLYPAETVYMELPVMQAEGEVVVDGEVVEFVAPKAPVGWVEVLRVAIAVIYLAVVALNVLRFVVRLVGIARLRRGAELSFYEAYTIAESRSVKEPFSFWRTIFLNYDYSGIEREQVIAHEASHIAHHHSAERVVMELLRCAFWFNPFVWYAGNALVQVQEWQADSDVLRKGYDVKQYRQIIFRQLFGYNPDITCGLRSQITKKRFIMMTDSMKGRRSLVRLMAMVPVVAAMILAFGSVRAEAVVVVEESAAEQELQRVEVNLVADGLTYDHDVYNVKFLVNGKSVKVEDLEPLFKAIKSQGRVDVVSITANNEILLGAVERVRKAARNAGIERIEYRGVDFPFIKADVMPTFEGGDLNSFRMWVMTQLRYPKEWVDEGLSGRVVVGFVVDKEGYIDENSFTVYRTPDSRLSDEVIRVIKLSPRWTAGKQDGEAVDVKFTIPVSFNAKTTDAPASSENSVELSFDANTADAPASSENSVEPIVVTRY